jgi:hypothetical protein
MRRAIVSVLLCFGCANADRAADPRLRLTAADSALASEQGGAIATTVAQGLAQQLQARIAEDGAPGAVDFCARTALALTDSLTAAFPGVTVKRTTMRLRNPHNVPDDLEMSALLWFDSIQDAGQELPPALVQVVGPREVRFYRPLVIAPFCTECHGSRAAMDPEVRRLISERYPDDQAFDYQPGDLRGVIRVSLPRAQP